MHPTMFRCMRFEMRALQALSLWFILQEVKVDSSLGTIGILNVTQ